MAELKLQKPASEKMMTWQKELTISGSTASKL